MKIFNSNGVLSISDGNGVKELSAEVLEGIPQGTRIDIEDGLTRTQFSYLVLLTRAVDNVRIVNHL